MTSPTPAELAGAYRLQPGRRPAIAGERPVLEGGRLPALLRGLRSGPAADRCAAVFTLCAHAHRRACEAAMAAAGGRPALHEADPARLQFETARDHLRTIALDWPARAGVAPRLDWLRGAPVRIAGPGPRDAAGARAALRRLAAWLAQEVLRCPLSEWLANQAEPQALAAWCGAEAARLPAARLLHDWHAAADRLQVDCVPLRVLAADAGQRNACLRALAAELAADPGFAQRPSWQGVARENGPWTRQRHAGGMLPSTAWHRLAARWIDLVELAAGAAGGDPMPPPGDPPARLTDGQALARERGDPALSEGALSLAPGEAIAWCEMARGLLFHWVRLDAAGQVQDYRVLAPTEWNFHPDGPLARALERLDPADTASAALLGTAFDACVPCSVVPPP